MPRARGDEEGGAPVGGQADVDEGEQEVGAAGGDDQITGQRQRAANAHGRPVDGGHHGLFHAADPRDDRVVALAQGAADVGVTLGRGVKAGLEIGPGGESAPGAADLHRSDSRVRGHRLHSIQKILAKLAVPRVHGLGPVELDARGAVAAQQHDGLPGPGGLVAGHGAGP